MRKIAYLLMGLLGSVGLVTAFALPASASAKPAVQVAIHYSEFLAGHAMQGNGSQAFEAVWGGATVPGEPLPAQGGPADYTVAVGLVMAASPVNPGPTYGLGLVWDGDGTTVPGGSHFTAAQTCGSDQWTLMAGFENTALIPGPVAISDMRVLTEFGGPVCVAPSGYLWMKMQQSTKHGVLSFIAGQSENDNDVISQLPTLGLHFLATGEGVTTTAGSNAADLNTGTLVSFDTWAVTDLASHAVGAHAVNRNALAFNYATYTGTEYGGAPSVADPVTLTPSSFTKVGYGSANEISVP